MATKKKKTPNPKKVARRDYAQLERQLDEALASIEEFRRDHDASWKWIHYDDGEERVERIVREITGLVGVVDGLVSVIAATALLASAIPTTESRIQRMQRRINQLEKKLALPISEPPTANSFSVTLDMLLKITQVPGGLRKLLPPFQ